MESQQTILDADVLASMLGQRDMEILTLRSQVKMAAERIAALEAQVKPEVTATPVADCEA